jgi:hypothetical protein
MPRQIILQALPVSAVAHAAGERFEVGGMSGGDGEVSRVASDHSQRFDDVSEEDVGIDQASTGFVREQGQARESFECVARIRRA